MELLALLLLMAQAPAAQPADTRVVETREAPISLVGLPCGNETDKLLAEEPVDDAAHDVLGSQPFACDKDCYVGVRVKKGLRIATFKIATATAHDRGRVTSTISPFITPSALRSCNGESVAVAELTKIKWPVFGTVVYVSEVIFQNGRTWRADGQQVVAAALRQWIAQPRSRQ